MKANEFFKKVGIGAVRSYLAAYEDALTDDLKRLVESHELVESYGGLCDAKYKISYIPTHMLTTTGMSNREKLIQAIADVESCQ